MQPLKDQSIANSPVDSNPSYRRVYTRAQRTPVRGHDTIIAFRDVKTVESRESSTKLTRGRDEKRTAFGKSFSKNFMPLVLAS